MVGIHTVPRLALFPQTAAVNTKDHLEIGGCDCTKLAAEYGTPLYVFDETDMRTRCREFRTEFTRCYPETVVAYSPKAFICKAMLQLVKEEGLNLDAVSGGEIAIALAAGFPADRIQLPGNNKSAEELELAVSKGIAHLVVDNLPELNMLRGILGDRKVNVLLRLSPGIDAHTHKYNTTGIVDSKFGLTRSTWDEAVSTTVASSNINLEGFHFHLGSGIFEMEPYRKAIQVVLEYAAEVREKNGLETKVVSIGGGFGVRYTLEDSPPPVSQWAEVIAAEITGQCRRLNIPRPRLIIEPGRAIVALAGVALYTVGVIKDIPSIRCYVCVDGGMGDNIRHPMYGTRQEALLANRVNARETGSYTIAGRYCESGDILIENISLPAPEAGDILAVAGSGAYCVPMQSNYNASLRPAIVFVSDGKARLVRRRETPEDLTRCDLV